MGGKATVETPQRTKERPISWDWAAQRRYGGKMVGKEHRHKKLSEKGPCAGMWKDMQGAVTVHEVSRVLRIVLHC